MSEKKTNKKSIEDDEEVSRKKSKKDKIHEKEDDELRHKKSKKEKKKEKKEKKEEMNKSSESEKNEKKEENSKNNQCQEQEPIIVSDKKEIDTDVHTANNWEEADLGNDQRKLKFLKLMGAFKHKSEKEVQHKHSRGKNETQKISEDLEKQFNEGLSHKFQKNHHLGLGYHSDEQASKKPENKHIVFDD